MKYYYEYFIEHIGRRTGEGRPTLEALWAQIFCFYWSLSPPRGPCKRVRSPIPREHPTSPHARIQVVAPTTASPQLPLPCGPTEPLSRRD